MSLLDLQRNVWRLDRLARRVPLGRPGAASQDTGWDALTLEKWKQKHIPSWGARAALTAIGDALRAPCGRVHWAGTETAREGCGYLDGAVESGERAATELSARLSSPG